ncbi:DUF6275 family protein [Vagococcus fluvialis]|uniref:DUF6275 family protein n=1 Tax=Vagococcus fluvialis TaxID=2738 RepID=UPI001D0AB3F7|nr:DUF6275 family protein [Vagococcus fluvialis]UDM74987.1 DUF6275 family protein [Vagococcus fluvialis]
MDNNKFIEKCKDILEEKGVKRDTIFVVWSCKTLQNNKAILSHSEKGAPLYELTHNGDKSEIYVDTYLKESNKCIKA